MNKILIVEDDKFAQQFYKMLLQRKGYETIFSEEPSKIFDILSNNDISLIIMDVNLTNTRIENKEIDGFELASLVKMKNFDHIPIILVSAFSLNENTLHKFKACKADDYIQKPITDFNLFLEKINELISKKKR